jgi:aryl-alcohol dehydrogenase-like predicted oxidoreductase
MRALDDLVRQGKVRYLACSNLFSWQIAKAAGISARMNLEPLIAGQYIYSLIHRELEREVIPAAVDHGLGLTCYGTLGGGLLTGKYKGQQQPAPGTRISFRTEMDGPRYWHPKGFQTAEILEKVSADTGIAMFKLAIAWPLRRRFVASVIVGVRELGQLEANLEIGDWEMPEELWNELEEQTRPEEEYLTFFNRQSYQRQFSAGDFYDEAKQLP